MKIGKSDWCKPSKNCGGTTWAISTGLFAKTNPAENYKGIKLYNYKTINPRLPEPLFVTRLPKEVVTITSQDICCKAFDSYDFDTGG